MIREAEKKELVKMLDSICGRHSRWEIWKDMVVMFACTIYFRLGAGEKEKIRERVVSSWNKRSES